MTCHILQHSGQNSHWVFAFYGYGQQEAVFDKLAALCKHKVGFAVIGLPYEKQLHAPSITDFAAFVQAIIDKNQIREITGISYSMGSRYNLLLAQYFPQRLKRLILIAPDGVRISMWYQLATSTLAGKGMFRYLMHHPAVYADILRALHQLKLLPSALFAFIKWHVRNKEHGSKVYNTWMNMKNMKPDLLKISRLQLEYGFPVSAFFGRNDVVIRSNVMNKLKILIPATEIKILEKDHNLLDAHLFNDIAANL